MTKQKNSRELYKRSSNELPIPKGLKKKHNEFKTNPRLLTVDVQQITLWFSSILRVIENKPEIYGMQMTEMVKEYKYTFIKLYSIITFKNQCKSCVLARTMNRKRTSQYQPCDIVTLQKINNL